MRLDAVSGKGSRRGGLNMAEHGRNLTCLEDPLARAARTHA